MLRAATLPPIYSLLEKSTSLSADAALAEALPRLESPYRDHAIRVLVRRATLEGQLALIEAFGSFESSAQRLVVASAAQMLSGLKAALAGADVDTRVNTIAIIAGSHNPRLADLLARAMRDSSARVRESAAAALLAFAERQYEAGRQVTPIICEATEGDPAAAACGAVAASLWGDERVALIRGLAEALTTFGEHHRLEVVRAAMRFAPELEHHLFDSGAVRRGMFTHAMLDQFERDSDPRFAAFAYVALTKNVTRQAIARRLAARTDTPFFVEMLRLSWLMRDPRIRTGLLQVQRLAWLERDPEALMNLPEEVQPLAPGWVARLGLRIETKVEWLGRLLWHLSHETASSAAHELVKLNNQGAWRVVERAMDHGDPMIARMLRQVGQRRRRIAHRRAAVGEGLKAGADFNEIWSRFEQLDGATAREIGAQLRTQIPVFASELHARLLSHIDEERFKAVRFVAAMHLSEEFREPLWQLAGDSDAFVRATVMTALRIAPGPTSRRILERALTDPDTRVVANALDALRAYGDQVSVESMLPLLENGDSRVRTNAVRALLHLRVPQAAVALIHMLSDERRAHRLSGLWLIEHLHLQTMRDRVAEVAKSDPDMAVRNIAAGVFKALVERVPAALVGQEAP